VLEENFELDPVNFSLTVEQTGDATAMVEYTDGRFKRSEFIGTWLTKENVEEFEFANGAMTPQVPTFEDFDIYPQDMGGLGKIDVSMDALFAGLPGDMPSESIDFMGLVFSFGKQKKGLGTSSKRSKHTAANNGAGLAGPRYARGIRDDGSMPDFSAGAEPMVLGFFTSLGVRWVSGPGQMVQLSNRIDNLLVEVTPDPIFSDEFEL